MIDLDVVVTFVLLWAVVMPTPGANSVMVTHVALQRGRRHMMLAVLGNMVGVLVLGSAALLGMSAVLAAAPWSRLALDVLGGLYLVWFGLKLLWRSRGPGAADAVAAAGRSRGAIWRTVTLGFVTALSNAQAIVFISSIFTVAGILDAGLPTGLACIAAMIAMNATYLTALGWLLTLPAPSRFYRRARRWLETVIGGAFVFFGGRMLAREAEKMLVAIPATRS